MFQVSSFKFHEGGQSLVEILVAISIGVILIGAATTALIPIIKSNLETQNIQTADLLAQDYLDKVKALGESDWHVIYNPPAAKGISSQFYLAVSGTTFAILSGTTSTIIGSNTFTRYFSVENVNRDLCGSGNISTNATTSCASGPGTVGVTEDPSTQKITATVTWSTNRSLQKTEYITRSTNKIFVQTDWSAGPGQEGPITSPNNQFSTSSGIDYASTTGSIKIQGL